MRTKRDGHRPLPDGRKIAKFFCYDCGRRSSSVHQLKISNDTDKIVKESLERASIRILSRRYQRGKKQIMALVHNVTTQAKDSIWIANHFTPKWSGVLALDGKSIKVYDKLSKQLKNKISNNEFFALNRKTWLCGIDYGTGDLPHYDIADEETKIDLVMYFQTLKEIGYPLRVLVCDGNTDIPDSAKHVYGEDIIVQLCTRHFTEALKRHAGALVEHSHTLKIINLIQRIIEAADLEQAGKYLSLLKQTPRTNRIEKELIAMFKLNSEKLTAHLLHPEIVIPHTTNDIENLFKQLNLRLKSIGRFNHWRYARDYLKFWALLRRFTPFTDCRKGRKWRNGKAPIELAGVNITGIDCLRL